MGIFYNIYDSAHAYGLDNMSPTTELQNLNATLIGNLVSQQTSSWGDGRIALGHSGVILTSVFSSGLTEAYSISNLDGINDALLSGVIYNPTKTDSLITFHPDFPETVTFPISNFMVNFGTVLQPENLFSGDDQINGNSYENILAGYGGDDQIDGGGGTDTAVFFGIRSQYTIVKTFNTIWVNGPDGSDTLNNVERLQFDDFDVAFDTDGATSAGGIYRLYQATFDRTPDLGGLGYWIVQAHDGESGIRMAENFTWSQEFQQLYGVTTHDNYQTGADISALVTGFYENLLHRAPDQEGVDFYINAITTHGKTVGQVLAEISDSPENYAATIGQIQNGIDYTPWVG